MLRTLFPGALVLEQFLSRDAQRSLVEETLALAAAPAGFYRPLHGKAGPMGVSMLCLGRHWNAGVGRYEATRSDHDGLPVQPLPERWKDFARRAAREGGMLLAPDVCVINRFDDAGYMGLHRDFSEAPETLAAGAPVVVFSLGCDARFLVGGLRRQDPTVEVLLHSGDVTLLGGESRLRFHGVAGIVPGSGPGFAGLPGRLSLTMRQY